MSSADCVVEYGGDTISYRFNIWDEDVFKFSVCEILSIDCNNEKNISELIDCFVDKVRRSGVQYLITRVDSSDIFMKKQLQKKGFHYSESSIEMRIKNFHKVNFNEIVRSDIVLEVPTGRDFKCMAEIARDKILFGRYHEDPNISLELARKRYFQWVFNMREQGKSFLVSKKDGQVNAFIAYEKRDHSIGLLLGGTDTIGGSRTFYFWSAFLENFKSNLSCTSVNALVSGSNIGIINLYYKFGFRAVSSSIGLHKDLRI